MGHRVRHRVGRGLATTAVVAMLLSACSGDEDDTDGAGPDESATTGDGPDGDGSDGNGAGSTEGADSTQAPDDAEQTTEEGPQAHELPRGGTEFFPEFRLFGYSGLPGSPGMGRMGIGDLDERVVEMEERGQEYAGGREQVPVLELIVTVVHPTPGPDGMYRTYIPESVIQDHLDAAREHGGILLLNIQPGRADFIDEVEHYEEWLTEPDVGVALDPEWAVNEGQVPGEVYGSTTGSELDEVAAYLSGLVEEHDLPEKVMVYHQVHTNVVRDEHDLQPHDGVVQIKSVDGIGSAEDKTKTYNRVNESTPDHVVPGFKLFYEEDAVHGPIMTGEQVLALDPQPEYILFE